MKAHAHEGFSATQPTFAASDTRERTCKEPTTTAQRCAPSSRCNIAPSWMNTGACLNGYNQSKCRSTQVHNQPFRHFPAMHHITVDSSFGNALDSNRICNLADETSVTSRRDLCISWRMKREGTFVWLQLEGKHEVEGSGVGVISRD